MNEKIRKTAVMLFLLMIVSGLSFGFILSGLSNFGAGVQRYKGMKFKLDPTENIWVANINGVNAAFSYLPQETETVLVEESVFSLLKSKVQIDATSDINDTLSSEIALAKYQMGLVMGRHNTFVQGSFTSENPFALPERHCANSTMFVPVVYFKGSNVSRISISDKCVIAEAARGDMARVKDRLIYGILEVIE